MIPYSRQFVTEEDIAAVVDVLRSDWLTTGPAVEKFEAALCAATGARFAVSCSSGTAALHLAALACDLAPGKRLLTSAVTFVASANCAEYCGAESGLVDIDPQTFCLSFDALVERLEQGERPAAVVPVDFAGVPADLPRIWALSRRYDFRVIADSAHSLGSTYFANEIECAAGSCRHSDMAIFSFHPVKTVTTAEGGAVMTNDEAFAERIRLARSHGISSDGSITGPESLEMRSLGYRYRLSDLQCALGISQLKRLPQIKARRREIFEAYSRRFADDGRLIIPPSPEGCSPCFHLYVLRFREGSARRNQVRRELDARGIQTQIHYKPIYRQQYFREKYGFAPQSFPHAEAYYTSCLSLPLYPSLTEDQIDLIVTSVNAALDMPPDDR